MVSHRRDVQVGVRAWVRLTVRARVSVGVRIRVRRRFEASMAALFARP